jgi:sugar phosphate isomerase/epimerase
MLKIKVLIFVVVGLIICTSIMCSSQKKLDNTFYAQNTFNKLKNAPQTASEKAKLIKTIGFDGLEGFGYEGFFELKKAIDNEGLVMPVNYVGIDFEAGENQNDSLMNQIKEMITGSSKGAIIYFVLKSKSYANNDEKGDKVIGTILRDLADYALPFGVKLGVYPHIYMYCETVEHSVKLANIVDRNNFGAVMNLCHLLRVEGSEGIEEKIKEVTPFLIAVNINGADDGDTKNFGWDRLIRPLGQGTFDTYRFVKLLKENGYNGPFGLQSYNIEGDFVETLSQSMNTWIEYKERYGKEND